MLLFVLYFFLSFSPLLWDAVFNNACRDLPPSRALAIAQGRLDPISMCAFDGSACKKPELLRDTLKVAKSRQGESADHPSCDKLMQGDVWLGTDEELLTLFAADVPEPSLSPLPSSAPVNAQPDNGFLAHLASMSNKRAVVQPHLHEQLPASNNTTVMLSPGKKRVLLPPPNNNPFKRGKLSDTSSGLSSGVGFLFDTQLDEKVFCREGHCLEKATCVPHQSSHEAIPPFCQTKTEAYLPIASGDPVVNSVHISSMSMKAAHSEGLTLAESRTVHVQDLESEKDTDFSGERAQVLIESEEAGDTQVSKQCKIKISASLPADGLAFKPVHLGHTCQSKAFTHAGFQVSSSPGLQDSGVIRNSIYGDSVSMGHIMSSTLHHLKAGTESVRAPTISKKMHRVSKAKEEIRISSKQSSKVVVVASTPSLLKFFQRASAL